MTKILVSFSGGRTSAYMARRLLDNRKPEDDLIFVIANSGQEDERTLIFADRCDREWGLNLVWIEAEVPPTLGEGIRHRIVTFETADRTGYASFEPMISKYGIPNKPFPHCSKYLKKRPIESYAKSIGWKKGDYQTAIGIRADEIDRQSSEAAAQGLIYPLLRWGVKKPFILQWWRAQPFDLDLEERNGNCRTCWKKSRRKLLTIAAEDPNAFSFMAEMEARYQFAGPRPDKGPHRFFRDGWTTIDLKTAARTIRFTPHRDAEVWDDPRMDVADGCSESCEVFGDHNDEEIFVDRDLFADSR